MQYPVKAICGHTYTYNIYGASKDRERKRAWLATQPCPTCRPAARVSTLLEEQEEEIAKETERIVRGIKTMPPEKFAAQLPALRHQLAEGLGTEIKREAFRRALARFDITP